MKNIKKIIKKLFENEIKDSYVFEFFYSSKEYGLEKLFYGCQESENFADAKFHLSSDSIITIKNPIVFLNYKSISAMYKNGTIEYVVADSSQYSKENTVENNKRLLELLKIREYAFKQKDIPLTKKMKLLDILRKNNIAYNK